MFSITYSRQAATHVVWSVWLYTAAKGVWKKGMGHTESVITFLLIDSLSQTSFSIVVER